jgi:hypothetical protein
VAGVEKVDVDEEGRRYVDLSNKRDFGESKRLLVESPWSQFTIGCQRF